MKLAVLILALLLASVPAAARADPNPQLVASIEQRLRVYRIRADVSQYATSTVAALHLTLSQPEGYFTTRRKLRAILRNAKYK